MLSNHCARCLAIVVLAFCVGPVLADEVHWRHDYAQARAEARRVGKPLFIDVKGTYCPPCKKLDLTTFRDAGIVAALNSLFIPVKIDGDQNMAFVKAMQIDSYPTLLVADCAGSILERHAGYLTADALKTKLTGVQARVARETPRAQALLQTPRAQAVLQAAGGQAPAAAAGVDLKVVKYRQLIDSVRARRGKIVVVGIWEASQQTGLSQLVELDRRYARAGVECLSVNVDAVARRTALAGLLRARSVGFAHFLLDEKPAFWQEKLSVASAPAIYVFSPEGKLECRYSQADGYDLDDIDEHIRKLLTPTR